MARAPGKQVAGRQVGLPSASRGAGRPQVVADPTGVRIFLPNGSSVSGPTPGAVAVAAATTAASAQAQQKEKQ